MARFFALDPRDPLPLYAQIERAIKAAIVTSRVKLGEQLPTVRQMAVDLKVNANTVAKVYAQLEAEGILATRRGVGTFVAAQPAASAGSTQKRAAELRGLAERFFAEAASRGYDPDELIFQMQRFASNPQEKNRGQTKP